VLWNNFEVFHRWSGKSFGLGGKFVNVSAKLDEIPVFFLGAKDDILKGNI
jgi:alpha-D-xyloside xylohydrolase